MTQSPGYIADFDSATAMLRAVANYLHGRDFPLLGAMPVSRVPLMRFVGGVVNALPRALREQVYIWSGWLEAIPPRRLREAALDRVCEWATGPPQWRAPAFTPTSRSTRCAGRSSRRAISSR